MHCTEIYQGFKNDTRVIDEMICTRKPKFNDRKQKGTEFEIKRPSFLEGTTFLPNKKCDELKNKRTGGEYEFERNSFLAVEIQPRTILFGDSY